VDAARRELSALFEWIASGDVRRVELCLDWAPELATLPLPETDGWFLASIHHAIYCGDTALHVAAAAYQREVAEWLVMRGADVRARNRRGAEPLHYAADGRPGASGWDPVAQGEVIAYLVHAGADPDAVNKSGVAPLHRAVRTRSSSAVSSLVAHGADPCLANKSGSTPLHLAVQNTGKSNSGSQAAKREQRLIIALLLEHGASPTDINHNGKTVAASESSASIRQLLENR
jgi:ankyrin repeat protein